MLADCVAKKETMSHKIGSAQRQSVADASFQEAKSGRTHHSEITESTNPICQRELLCESDFTIAIRQIIQQQTYGSCKTLTAYEGHIFGMGFYKISTSSSSVGV
ncbi:hypothetical protein PsorP6_002741 [Peronosclerospora sorghi]|uniref:Uncharacterized protein n=1 Tax=Peronosclerospora sorghi TaxID=230839 RepID=A0ACC0WU69_9STRA|nr:hypothetical protein PsorP6_002741 [Peronosclerospora sorghi]